MSEQKLNILVIEDQIVNRMMLKKILSDDYNIIEADNGKTALSLLYSHGKKAFSAIILDLVMPEMNGYEVLEAIHGTEFSEIPIIVTTGERSSEPEQRVLKMGACDYVSKPYNADILRTRLKNAIFKSRMYILEQMQYMAEHSAVCGLFNRSKSFAEARRILDSSQMTDFAFVRVDIVKFNLYNSIFGEKGGDALLLHVASLLRTVIGSSNNSVIGHVDADLFFFCEPYDEELLNSQINAIAEGIKSFRCDYTLKPCFGVYIVNNHDIPIEAIYTKASVAARKCKNKYNSFAEYYDNSLDTKAEAELQIESEMQHALDSDQFKVWLQPKYEMSSGIPCGAEALVRWIHPEKGIISPGTFIPVFEQNGFIAKLDSFMWESTAALLKKWTDEGLSPAPVSVNVSRISMYNPHLADILTDIITRYSLPPSMLNLELTESAYMDDPQLIRQNLDKLHEHGFTVMMDDFGSGFSSLNTLKDLKVDVLKIDMGFLYGDDGDEKSRIILASVAKMATALNLPVIVEGVETAEQRDFLLSIGCKFAQGYFFAKPMPADDYESLIGVCNEKSCPVSFRSIGERKPARWIPSLDEEALLRSLPEPVAVLGHRNGNYYLIQVSDSLRDELGYSAVRGDTISISEQNVSKSERERLLECFRVTCEQHAMSTCVYTRNGENGTHTYRARLKYLEGKDDNDIIIVSFCRIK